MEKSSEAQPDPAPAHRSLLIFENPDKLGARPSGVDPAMPMWPFRLLLSGPPGCGKRNLLLNVVYKLVPPPSAIHIVHIDPDTTEYECLEEIGCPMVYWAPDDFPTIEDISSPEPVPIGDSELDPVSEEVAETEGGGESPLVIIDEITADLLKPAMKSRFERLMNFGSSHKNCSVMCSIQSVTALPPKCRRGFNQFCLWPQPDVSATTLAANRCGVPPAMLHEMFEGLCKDPHDCVWIDTVQPPDSKWRFRLNFLWPITATETVRLEKDYG